MKAKQSIWKKRLVKTTYFLTAILVAALFLGGAASAGFAPETTMNGNINSTQAQQIAPIAYLGQPDGPAPDNGQTYVPEENSMGVLGMEPFYVCNDYSPYNLYTITPTTPGSPVLLGNPGISTYLTGGCFDNDGVYWACSGSAGNIYKINKATGVATLVGAGGVGQLNGLACNPVTNRLYAVGSTALYEINKGSGAGTLIGSSAGTWIDIYIDKAGNAYVLTVQFSGNSNFYKMDLSTGAVTLIGSTGINFCYAQGGDYDMDNGILYHAGYVYPAGTAGLYTINPLTAATTYLGAFPSSWEPDGMAIEYQLKPFEHDVKVVSIDAPVTGEAQATIIPKATVKNTGNNTETFNVVMDLFTDGVGTSTVYTEGFETWVPKTSPVFPPTGWGIQDKNGGYSWLLNDTSAANSHSGFGNAYIRNDTTQNSDVLYTKPIYIAANGTSFSFWYKVWLNGAPETFKIGYWTGIEPDWIWVDTVNTNSGTWQKYTWNVPSNLTGSSVYFAINYTSNDWYGMRVDDFTLADGTTEGFEPIWGYFAGTPNWRSVWVSGTNPKAAWQMANAASAVMNDHNPYAGAQMAWFKVRSNAQSPDSVRLQMDTPVDLAALGQMNLVASFWLYTSTSGSSYQDKVALDISVDGGVKWIQLGEWRQYESGTSGWKQKQVSLAGYEDCTSVLFGFRASAGSSASSGYDITIDEAQLLAIPYTTIYTNTKQVVNLTVGSTQQITFDPWTVPGWQNITYENTNVKYNVRVKAVLPADEKPLDNYLRAAPQLHYPFLHDVAITAIDKPVTGPGGVSIPVAYTIKNVGQYPENGAANWFFSNISIKEIPGTIAISEDFSDSIPKPEAYGDGWTEQLVSGTATTGFSCRFASYYPSGVLPIQPPMMLEYNSYSISSGGSSRMISEPLNLTGVGEVRLKFYMYHDSGYSTSADKIQWQYSTDNGATWINFAGGMFYRSSTLQGVTPSTWVEWKVDASAITNMSNVRIGILATSAYGNDIMMDNVRLTKLSDGTIWKQYTFNTYTPAYVDFNPADGFTVQKTDAYGFWSVYGTSTSTYAAKCYEIDSYGAQDEWLITRNLTTGADTWLKFYRYFYRGGSYPDSTAYVYASDDGGVTWPYTLYTWTSSQTSPTIVETQLPSWANNQNDLRIAFRFVSGPDAQPTSTYKADYLRIDDLLVSDKATFQDYMSPYVPPVVMNPGDSVTVTPVNWAPSHTASGAVSYQAVAQTWLSTDTNLANNNFVKSFTLTFGHDLAVTAITQPSTAWIGGLAHSVEATIKNMGTFTESKTATATITDLGTSTVIYTSTFDIVGITSGTEITATFDDFTPTASGNYKLRVEVPADDVAANNYKEFSFGADLTAPVSTHTLNPASPNGQNGWYVSDVTITISATDAGVGVDTIYYKIGAGTWNVYSGVITLSADGLYDIKYYAVDKLGNEEGEHSIATIKIDKTAPTITLSVNALNTMKTKWLLSASVSDATSGIAKVEFYIADALVGTVTSAPWEYIYQGTDGPAFAIVYDNAGNSKVSEEVASFELNNNAQQTRPLTSTNEI